MKLGLLVLAVVVAVALVPGLSEGRIVSKCELKNELGKRIVVPKWFGNMHKQQLLAVVICELNRKSLLDTSMVDVEGERGPTTTTTPVPATEVTTLYTPWVDEMEGETSTTGEVPTEEIPTEEMYAEEMHAEEMPTEEMPTEEMPAEEMPTEEMPTEDVPAEYMTMEGTTETTPETTTTETTPEATTTETTTETATTEATTTETTPETTTTETTTPETTTTETTTPETTTPETTTETTTETATTEATTTETTPETTTTEATTPETTTTETTPETTTTETTTTETTPETATTEATSETTTTESVKKRRKREVEIFNEEHIWTAVELRMEEMVNCIRSNCDELEIMNVENKVDDDDSNEEADDKGNQKPWSIGRYGVFQLSDGYFCDSGHRWSKNKCKLSCSNFTNGDITDDIDCFVRSGCWKNIFQNRSSQCSLARVKNYFDECRKPQK